MRSRRRSCGKASVRTSIRVPGRDRAGHRRRGDGGGPGRRALTPPTVCRRSAIACRAGQELGRLEPRLSGGGEDRATLAAAVAEAQAALDGAQGRTGARRAAAGRTRRSRRGASKRRGAPSRRRGARSQPPEARLAQRDETLRSGGGAAVGQRVRAARADRRPGRRGHRHARRLVRRRRAALQHRAHRPRRAAGAGAGQPTRRSRARRRRPWRSKSRAAPIRIALKPHHVHDAGVIDPKTRALPLQIEVDNPDGQLLVGQTGTAMLYTAQRAARAGRAEGRRADRSGPAVRVRADRRRTIRAAVRRGRRRATATWSACGAGVKPGDRVVDTRRLRRAAGVGGQGTAGGRPRPLRVTMKRLIQWSIEHHWMVIGLSVLLLARRRVDGARRCRSTCSPISRRRRSRF